jgi:expansin (peptidoglycan-binding protein)
LGPVDFAESEWTNACSPIPSSLYAATGLGGEYLAGVSNANALQGGVCDACILVKTGQGRQIVARVVTYGDTNEPGDIDVSPSVYAALNTGEYPRSMSWQFAKCPDTGKITYQFQTGANEWWTSLWVRNARVPVTKVEVQSTNHKSFVEMDRGTDGTLTDGSGFGAGSFTLRLTGMDGQVISDTFPSFTPGQLITSTKQFQ